MGKEENCYMLIYLLYEFDLFKHFEKFVLDKNFVESKKNVTRMDFDDFATCIELFVESFKLQIKQKQELLKYCNKQWV